ncbi:MAG: DUF5011 domain-containing protein [bacterium]|nr:DUF5011 domain-containing protein [bacterium]
MVISSGDAREIRTEWFSANAGGGGVSDATWGTLYDLGGVDIDVSLPSGTSTLEFDLQYVAHDYTPYEDPVRIFLNGVFVREFTIQSEFGGFPGGLNIGPVRHVVLDVSGLSGTATIRFQASDRWDHILDGGAIIDNLTVGASGTPDITSVTPFGGHFQLDVQDDGYLPPNGGPTNQPPVAISKNIDVNLDANGNATITAADVDNGSYDPDGDPITLGVNVSSFNCDDLGANTIILTVTDDKGESNTVTATVTVHDITPPVITLNGAADVSVECNIGTYTELGATAADACDPNVQVVIAGSVDVSVDGDYTITYNATDASGNVAAQVTRTVHVVDTTPPVVDLNLELTSLWPPNHKMYRVATGSVTDACASIGSDLTLGIVVTSNQPINGLGDGNTDSDWIVNDNGDGTFEVWLRAERSGKDGERIYTLTVTSSDGPNTTTAMGEVHVVHNQGNGKKNAAKPVVISSTVGEQANPVADLSGPLSSALDVVSDARFAEIAQPQAFELRQNYPNPFNPETTIQYSLVEASGVRLTIYNVLGQEMRVLVNEGQGPGMHTVRWDGKDAFGRQVTSGLYLYRLEAGVNVAVNKMMFTK